MHWVYYFGRVLIRVLALPLVKWETKGRENLRGQGPFLIVCNHINTADPPIVASSVGIKAVFMAKEELFQNGWSRFWVKNFGAFPVNRRGMDRQALRSAEYWLKKGVSLIMFPEGRRSAGAKLQPAYPGAALIASRLNIPVVPVGIIGTQKLKNIKWCFLHHPTITINIGEPFRLNNNGIRPDREQRSRLTYDMMVKIADLLPPEYRGVYSGGENAKD